MRYFGVFFLKRLVNEYAIDVPMIKINLQTITVDNNKNIDIKFSAYDAFHARSISKYLEEKLFKRIWE